MINWTYDSSAYSKQDFTPIPEGAYRVRITKAEEGISKSSGYQMITLTLEVNGYKKKTVLDYVVFSTKDEKAIHDVNQKVGRIFDSFQIEQGDLNVSHWEGKDGGAYITIREEEYKGEKRKQNRVRNYLVREKVETLPFWEGIVSDEGVNFDDPESIPF